MGDQPQEAQKFNGLHTDEEINGNSRIKQEEVVLNDDGSAKVSSTTTSQFIKQTPTEEVK